MGHQLGRHPHDLLTGRQQVLTEVPGQPVGDHWVAFDAGEHVAAVVVGVAECCALGFLGGGAGEAR